MDAGGFKRNGFIACLTLLLIPTAQRWKLVWCLQNLFDNAIKKIVFWNKDDDERRGKS